MKARVAMFKVAVSLFLSCWALAAQAQGAACSDGVDGAYCRLAAATGGEVVTCDRKRDGPLECERKMREMMERATKPRVMSPEQVAANREKQRADRAKDMASMTQEQRASIQRDEREEQARSARKMWGARLAVWAGVVATAAFAAWIVGLGRPWARWAAAGMGLAVAVASCGAWLAMGDLPLRGVWLDRVFKAGCLLAPALWAAGVAWASARGAVHQAPSRKSRALAALKVALAMAVGCSLWLFSQFISSFH